MKELRGSEIAGYMKANQAHQVMALKSNRIKPKLVIIRDSDNPVIEKYVNLKRQYGDDIGVIVEDWFNQDIAQAIDAANQDNSVHGVIVQLPLAQSVDLDSILNLIASEKDVDGLSATGAFESATATAINWLLAGYDVPMENLRIALVGRGRLIGRPLAKMWQNSGYDITVFHRGSDLSALKDYGLIVSATGTPHLITSDMVKTGAYVIDAGTASEGGVLVGDVSDEVRARTDLSGITPRVGGVGPLTVTALFEHVLTAAKQQITSGAKTE